MQASDGTAVHDANNRERNRECGLQLIRPHSGGPRYKAKHVGCVCQANHLQQAPGGGTHLAAQRSAPSRATPETACAPRPGQTPEAPARRPAGRQRCLPAGRRWLLPAGRQLPRARSAPSRWPGAQWWLRNQSSWEGRRRPARWSEGACRCRTCMRRIRGRGQACSTAAFAVAELGCATAARCMQTGHPKGRSAPS